MRAVMHPGSTACAWHRVRGGVFAALALLTAACVDSSGTGDAAAGSVEERVLAHLEEEDPGFRWRVDGVEQLAPGWTAVRVSAEELPEEDFFTYVVRDDGIVVIEGRQQEVGDIFRELDVLDGSTTVDVDQLAQVGLALLGPDGDALLTGSRYPDHERRHPHVPLSAPELSHEADVATLSYWTYSLDELGLYRRHELRIGPSYEIEHQVAVTIDPWEERPR